MTKIKSKVTEISNRSSISMLLTNRNYLAISRWVMMISQWRDWNVGVIRKIQTQQMKTLKTALWILGMIRRISEIVLACQGKSNLMKKILKKKIMLMKICILKNI